MLHSLYLRESDLGDKNECVVKIIGNNDTARIDIYPTLEGNNLYLFEGSTLFLIILDPQI